MEFSSPRMPISPRHRSAVRSVLLAIIGVFASCWLLLYLDSLHERRRAEHLIADLKSFPFATAGFPEVRELANRYGGTAVQSFPFLQLLPPGTPLRKFTGSGNSKDLVPEVRTTPTCTPQDCTFTIRIKPRLWLYDLRFNYKVTAFLASILAHVGLRPWVVYASFEVRDGKLWESFAGAGQGRHERLGSYEGLVMLGYAVNSMSKANALYRHRPDYAVCVPHITGTVSEDLWTYFVQAPSAPASRAFDIDLQCLTAVMHPCRGFDVLAPSAWVDYQGELHHGRNETPNSR